MPMTSGMGRTKNERLKNMKLVVIIVGIITVIGSVGGMVYAIIREIRKDQLLAEQKKAVQQDQNQGQ